MSSPHRMPTKIRKVGTSHVITVPWQIVKAFNLKQGDPMVIYTKDHQLVVVPLAYVAEIGIPPVVHGWERTLDLMPSSPKYKP